jgi:hypothetical protein
VAGKFFDSPVRRKVFFLWCNSEPARPTASRQRLPTASPAHASIVIDTSTPIAYPIPIPIDAYPIPIAIDLPPPQTKHQAS